MDARTVSDIESWDRRATDGDLEAVADRGFSGVVRAGVTYLFVVSGRPVGVFDYREDPSGDPTVTEADLEAVSSPDEAFEAPHPALPLLYAMQAAGGETRGRYYTNDTPLPEVDRTLQDGNFTGYLVLSENVLSGDYYLVYHGGRRRTVAFVGQSRRLKTDEEAFELAADEVGIYTVERVSLPNLSFPDGVGGGAAGSAGAAGAGAAAGAAMDSDTATDANDPTPDPEPTGRSTADASASGEGPATDASSNENTTDTRGTATDTSGGHDEIDIDITPRTRQESSANSGASGSESASEPEPEPVSESPPPTTDEGTESPGPDTERAAEPDSADERPDIADDSADTSGTDSLSESSSAFVHAPDDASVDEASEPEADPENEASQEDVEAAAATVDADRSGTESAAGSAADGSDTLAEDHVVPSLDPSRSDDGTEDADEGDPETVVSGPETPSEPDTGTEETSEAAEPIVDGETVTGLREELAEREAELERLREALSESEAEREALEERIAELERRLAQSGAAPEGASKSLTPAEALAGTSLFVRYRSKRDPTLSDAVDGADHGAVADNLRLEQHTTFDAGEVSVDGRSFDAFLGGTQAHAFVRWLVEDLPYEIRDTGSTDAMRALYEALPSLDRVEFDGEIETDSGAVAFDLVGRDRMGNPLIVALLEDVREPTDEATLGQLVTDATAIAERNESLAGAFCVTSAYFEPAALSTADEATSGSLLSRSKRKSFVKLSRNQGFHLALVEDREDSFYLSVPEL